jgi:hypothetical protein
VGHVVHSGASGHETSTHYFLCLVVPGAVSIKKRARTSYTELMFLHLVGSAGHIVQSYLAVVQNVNALLFMLGGPGAVSIKSTPGHVTLNLCFCIW